MGPNSHARGRQPAALCRCPPIFMPRVAGAAGSGGCPRGIPRTGGDGMRIYVAGPYTAPTPAAVEANVARAIDAGLALARAGHEPFIPHLAHYLELRAQATGEGLPYAWYLAYDRF